MSNSPFHLLLAEDNPRDVALFREYLNRGAAFSDHTLEHTSSIKEARACVETEHFDLVILDLDLEDVKGLETFEIMRAEVPDTPIVILTGHDDQELADKMIEAGAQDYLLKEEINTHWLNKSIRYAIDRHRAQKKQKESERHYQALFEQASDAIFVESLDDEILNVNRKATELLGYSRDELIGMSLGEIVAAEQRPGNGEYIIEERLKQYGETLFETVNLRKDNRRVPVEVHQSRVQYDDMERVITFVRDISERKEAERARLQSERRLREMAETIEEGFWITDGKMNRLEYTNDSFDEMFGLEDAAPSDKIQQFFTRIHPADRERTQQLTERFKQGEEIDEKYRYRGPQGEIRWTWVRAYPIEVGGGVERIIGTNIDVTKSKHYQIQLEERYKEQQCLHSIAELSEDTYSVTDNLFREIVDRIPTGYQQPSRTHARLILEDRVYTSGGFTKTNTHQSAALRVNGKIIGKVQIFLECNENEPEQSFLTEEASMLRVIASDISSKVERIRAKQQIKEQAQFLDVINDRMPGVVYQFKVDTDGSYSFSYMSEGYGELTGVSAEQAEANFEDAVQNVHPDDRETLMHSIASAVENFETWRHEFRYQLPDGETKWVFGSSRPSQQPDGSIVFSGILLDITDRKDFEQELRESEERFRQIAENIEEVFWISTPDTSEMLYVSPAYEEVWRQAITSLYEDPTSFLDSIHPEDRDRVVEAMKKQAEGEYDIEYRVCKPEGEIRWIRDRAFPVENEQGEVYRITGLAEDITERKQVQQQLEQSLKEKEILLQEVHHRVRNNLQLITSLLGLQSRKTTSAEALDALRNSKNRIQSMALVHRKLYETEDLITIKFPEYVEDLVTLLIDDMGPEDGGIDYELEIDDRFQLDTDSLIPCGLIINELVTNSLKHGFKPGDEGTITVSFKKVHDQFQLTVSDTGRGGLDLDSFDELNSLGIRLVNNIVNNQLHGTIGVTNGRGVITTITFPPKEQRYP